MTETTYGFEEDGRRFILTSPTAMPAASTFLWNRRMLLQLNCRGFATAQFMQPEPAKYAHAPTLEAKTFMQPEQPYYAHHPGRLHKPSSTAQWGQICRFDQVSRSQMLKRSRILPSGLARTSS